MSVRPPGGDPGWAGALRHVWRGLSPVPGLRRARGGGVTALRGLFLGLLAAGLLIGVVLWTLEPGVGELDPGPAALVAGFGAVALAASARAIRLPLDTESPEALAGSYRTRFFLGFALADAALLTGFIACFVVDAFWPYLVGLLYFLVGMKLIAPTRANIERAQQDITARGSTLSLLDALDATPARRG